MTQRKVSNLLKPYSAFTVKNKIVKKKMVQSLAAKLANSYR